MICYWRLRSCSNWQYHRDHQEDYTFRYSLLVYYSTILMNPNADAFYPICTSSSSVPISPTLEHPTCLPSPSFFQENAVLYPEVLEESEAQAPGPPPFTLHLSDPNMSVDTPWGPPEEGRPSHPLPHPRLLVHSDPTYNNKISSDLR